MRGFFFYNDEPMAVFIGFVLFVCFHISGIDKIAAKAPQDIPSGAINTSANVFNVSKVQGYTPAFHLGVTGISLKPAYIFAAWSPGVIGHRHVAGVPVIPYERARA